MLIVKKSGASPKSGDIAFGARTALDFNGHFHYVAIFEKTVESQRKIFNEKFFFVTNFCSFEMSFEIFWIDSEFFFSKTLVENFHFVAMLVKKR